MIGVVQVPAHRIIPWPGNLIYGKRAQMGYVTGAMFAAAVSHLASAGWILIASRAGDRWGRSRGRLAVGASLMAIGATLGSLTDSMPDGNDLFLVLPIGIAGALADERRLRGTSGTQ